MPNYILKELKFVMNNDKSTLIYPPFPRQRGVMGLLKTPDGLRTRSNGGTRNPEEKKLPESYPSMKIYPSTGE